MYKYIVFLFGSSLLLTGCMMNTYHAPTPGPGMPSLATIKGSADDQGFFTFKHFSLISIDNQRVSYGMFQNELKTPITVLPGNHTMIVRGVFSKGFASGPQEALIEISAKISGGMNYTIVGEVETAKILAWLDGNGQRMSSIGSGVYSAVQSNTYYVPIVVK